MNEVKEWLDFILTAKQQVALAIITIAVMAATEIFKHIWFGFFPERRQQRKKAIIWLFTACFGMTAGIVCHFIVIPKQPLWFWLFAGLTSTILSVALYMTIIEKVWPKLKSKM